MIENNFALNSLLKNLSSWKMLIQSNILGNIEAFEEASDILVWGLPWKAPRSDYSVTVHWLSLTAGGKKIKQICQTNTDGERTINRLAFLQLTGTKTSLQSY